MRIRKQQPRGSAGGESSGANLGPGSQEQELVQSSRGVKEKPRDEVQMFNSASEVVVAKGSHEESGAGRQVRLGLERVDSASRSAFTWLDKLRYSKGFTEIEPYSNLEDFITSLSKEGASSSKGRTAIHEEVVEESDLSRLVGVPDLNAQQLGRYNSVCSELSSKQASGMGPEGTVSPALVSCDDSSMSASLAQGHQLRSDASLPSAFRRNCYVAERTNAGMPTHDASKEVLDSEHTLANKNDKQKGEESSKAIREGYAGTSSEKPVVYEIKSGTMEGPCTDISLSQLATVEAVFKQGHGSSRHAPWRRFSFWHALQEKYLGMGTLFILTDSHAGRTYCLRVFLQLALEFVPQFLSISIQIRLPAVMLWDAAELGSGLKPYTIPDKEFMDQGFATIAEAAETRSGTPPRNDQIQGPTETTQRRSHRNRRIPSLTETEHRPDAAAMAENPPSALSPDHPALQPKDSLAFSVYTVCQRAGKAGKTAREAMSDILQQGLAGLEEGGAVQSSRHIAKLLRNSPYYMELGEAGKFALCSALIDTQQQQQGEGSPQPPVQDKNITPGGGSKQPPSQDRNIMPGEGSSHPTLQGESLIPQNPKSSASSEPDKACQKRRQSGSAVTTEPESEAKTRPGRSGRPKKLKYMKQQNAEELGNQCNRTDGKGWVCPLLAKPGYQLCDHHLDKLRCKPGSRSKKKSKMAAASTTIADEATTITTTDTTTHAEPHLDTAGHEYHHTML